MPNPFTSDSDLATEFSRKDLRTLRRLSKGTPVRADLITGLFDRTTANYYREHPDAVPLDWADPTTTINGQSLPGTLKGFTKNVTVVDEVIDGRRVNVNLGTRKAGTRVWIHAHEGGGSAAFLIRGKGKLNTWTQGLPDDVVSKGDYYYSPTNIPVSAANLTDHGVRILDILVTPVDVPQYTVIEPG